jgi:hypothetical protein
MNDNTASLMTLGATQGVILFTTLLPPRSDLYQADPNTETKQNLRQGELIAVILTMGFSGLVSYLSKDSTAVVIGAATCATLVLAYELTLHMKPLV